MMKEFIIYLFKAAIWSGVFWSLYYFLLRKETFYRFNRIFLLAGIPLAFLLPLLHYRYPVLQEAAPLLPEALANPLSLPETTAYFPLSGFLLSGYILITFLLLFRGLFALHKISRMIRKYTNPKKTGSYVIDSADFESSFSAFGYVFINSAQLWSPLEKEMIIRHESAHVEQKHWIDLVTAHLLCVVQWFNPFAWLYLRAVKQNHEFLADEAVIKSGHIPNTYRAVLINHQLQAPVLSLGNSFACYRFNRIGMIGRNASHPLKKTAVLLLLPALALFLWAFAEPEYRTAPGNQEALPVPRTFHIRMDDFAGERRVIVTNQWKTDTLKNLSGTPSSIRIQGRPTVATHTKPNTTGIDLNGLTIVYIVDGKEISSQDFSQLKLQPDRIETISVLKDSTAMKRYGKKTSGVMIITTKDKKGGL